MYILVVPIQAENMENVQIWATTEPYEIKPHFELV